MTTPAAKYKRISRDREGLQLGIERQDEDLEELGGRRGLHYVADYFDNDLSASTKSRKPRPGYQRMLADARAGKFRVIVAYTTGRITRRPREFEDLIDLAVEHGVEFQYVRSPEFDLATAQGRRIARTLAAQDAGEAEEIAERVARQKLQAATAGEWRGGRRPYGFENDGVTVRPSEAAEVLRASEAVLRGASLRSIATDWNRRGLVTSTGKAWRQDTVRKVLMRARNAGLIEVTRTDGTREIVGKANWPAIVPDPIWRGVAAVIKDPERRTQFSSVRKWMGSGLYLCGHCGSIVRATTGGASRSRPKIAYMCTNGKHVVRNAEEVDDLVTRVVVARLSRPDAIELLAADDGPDVAALHTQAAAIRAQLDELAARYAADELTGSQLSTGSRLLRQRLDDAEREIGAAAQASVFDGIAGVPDVAAVWESYDLDRRRAIINELMVVTLLPSGRGRPKGWKPGGSYFDPDTVKVDWKR